MRYFGVHVLGCGLVLKYFWNIIFGCWSLKILVGGIPGRAGVCVIVIPKACSFLWVWFVKSFNSCCFVSMLRVASACSVLVLVTRCCRCEKRSCSRVRTRFRMAWEDLIVGIFGFV